MARVATRFTQADVLKALKAARAAGFDVSAVEIDQDGTIRIVRQSEQKIEAAGPSEMRIKLNRSWRKPCRTFMSRCCSRFGRGSDRGTCCA
jgi:hypothetical protein